MLITRIATAVILIPLVVVGIFTLPSIAAGAVYALFMVVGAWEWARLLGWVSPPVRLAFSAAFVVLAALLGWAEWRFTGPGAAGGALLALACVWWLLAVYWLRRFPAGWDGWIGRPSSGGTIGLLVLLASTWAIYAIHAHTQGAALLLLFFALIWGADSGAYFAGRALGRHKLAPAVSPGKTVEGAAGGIAAALLVAAIGGVLMGYTGPRLFGLLLLGGWIAVVSIIGDLTLSMFKRRAGIKDSGALFPGHGGVLDRLDSVLAAAPWFALGLFWLQPG